MALLRRVWTTASQTCKDLPQIVISLRAPLKHLYNYNLLVDLNVVRGRYVDPWYTCTYPKKDI